MNVFVAGGSGTIGTPLVRALVSAGHSVTAMTRTPEKEGMLRTLGASVAIADALDREAVARALAAARPTHVIHQLTALPKAGVSRSGDLEATNRLRIDGTRNLLEAAMSARARRFLVGSFAPLSPREDRLSDDPAALAVQSMETQVLEAAARGTIEGVVLRYGLFYGPAVPSTLNIIDMVRKGRMAVVRNDTGQLPVIHLDDAVTATVLALERATTGGVYDIVDDRPVSVTELVNTIAEYSGLAAPRRVPAWMVKLLRPYAARLMSMRLPLSNARARAELGWRPQYPSIREGLAAITPHAA